MIFHPDTLRSVSPELAHQAGELTKIINHAIEIQTSDNWGSTYTAKDKVRLMRVDENGKYILAPKETVMGTPAEFLKNLELFSETGELPSSAWENEVEQRDDEKSVASRQSSYDSDIDHAELEREEEYRKKNQDFKVNLERKFSFISIDIGDKLFDQQRIFEYLIDTDRTLESMPADLIAEISVSEIYFAERPTFLHFAFKQPVEMRIKVPCYYEVLDHAEALKKAAKNLRAIRIRNSSKFNNPISMPTEKTFFWLKDLEDRMKSKYGIEIEMGKYDEFDEQKTQELQDVLDELEKLDDKYTKALKGTRVIFSQGNYRLTIKYAWGGVPDADAWSMVRRVKDVVDGGYLNKTN